MRVFFQIWLCKSPIVCIWRNMLVLFMHIETNKKKVGVCSLNFHYLFEGCCQEDVINLILWWRTILSFFFHNDKKGGSLGKMLLKQPILLCHLLLENCFICNFYLIIVIYFHNFHALDVLLFFFSPFLFFFWQDLEVSVSDNLMLHFL